MTNDALMKKGEATMNVPPGKVEEYKLDGWVVIDRPPEPAPAPQLEEIKPQAKTSVEVDSEQTPLNVEQVVERIGKRSKKG